MAIAVQQTHPMAHLPLVLGIIRRLEVATVIDHLIPPHPAHGLSCGRGVEAMVLAILDGHHALYKVGKRLEERGMEALLRPGLTHASGGIMRYAIASWPRPAARVGLDGDVPPRRSHHRRKRVIAWWRRLQPWPI